MSGNLFNLNIHEKGDIYGSTWIFRIYLSLTAHFLWEKDFGEEDWMFNWKVDWLTVTEKYVNKLVLWRTTHKKFCHVNYMLLNNLNEGNGWKKIITEWNSWTYDILWLRKWYIVSNKSIIKYKVHQVYKEILIVLDETTFFLVFYCGLMSKLFN